MPDEPPLATERTSVLLAEYTALRAEIASRSAAQHTLINIDLTACGAIAGLALSGRVAVAVLLLIPFLSGCCAMLYFDHAAQIDTIGSYLDTEVRPALARLLDDDSLLRWEGANKVERSQRRPLFIRFGIPLLLLFVLGPAALCAGLVVTADAWWKWAALAAGFVVQGVVCTMWFSLFRRWAAPSLPGDAPSPGDAVQREA